MSVKVVGKNYIEVDLISRLCICLNLPNPDSLQMQNMMTVIKNFVGFTSRR